MFVGKYFCQRETLAIWYGGTDMGWSLDAARWGVLRKGWSACAFGGAGSMRMH